MDITSQQKSKMNNIIQKEIAIAVKYAIQQKVSPHDNRYIVGLIAGRSSQKILDLLSSDKVHDSKKDISKLRGTLRKMRRWSNKDDEFQFGESSEDYKVGYNECLTDSLALTKKMLSNHDIDRFFQNKMCLKCGNIIEPKKDSFTEKLGSRGVMCVECVPHNIPAMSPLNDKQFEKFEEKMKDFNK